MIYVKNSHPHNPPPTHTHKDRPLHPCPPAGCITLVRKKYVVRIQKAERPFHQKFHRETLDVISDGVSNDSGSQQSVNCIE